MNKITRKEMKSDKFAEEVFDIWDWIGDHRAEATRYGAIALAVIVVAAAIYGYTRYQAGARQDALTEAQRISNASVGAVTSDPTAAHYDSQAQKDQAVQKAYGEVAAKYSGSEEGAVAALFLAGQSVDRGNLADAEKRYRMVVDDAPKDYAAIGRLALGQVLVAEGKNDDAVKVLRQAVDNPTTTVSKEEASIALAGVLVTTNPAEAKKLLDPLRVSPRGAVGRAAQVAYAKLPADIQNPPHHQPAAGK